MLTIAILAFALLLSPSIVAAEPFGGVFVGAALPRDTDVDQKVFSSVTFKDVEFDTSVVFGGKAGYFFETPILGGNTGLELEVYHFRPDIEKQTVNFSANGFSGERPLDAADLHITAIALNALYRFPLARSTEFPRGRFHPYLGVGVGAFIAHLETRTTILDANTDFGDTDVRPAMQAVAGARFFLTRHLALFGEYKFVHTADFTFTLISDPGTRAGLSTVEINKLQADLTTHMLQVGIAYHW